MPDFMMSCFYCNLNPMSILYNSKYDGTVEGLCLKPNPGD